ncbi:MAG: hypothetical protein ABJC89_06350 [Acidobacteriota bacterium]
MRVAKFGESPLAIAAASAADPVLQRIWFSIVQKPWSSLAVIPIGAALHDRAGRIARSLVSVGGLHGARPVRFLDATGVELGDYQQLSVALKSAAETNSMVIRLDCVTSNPTALALARATTAILLLVQIGDSRLSAIRSVVDAVGRERVIGCVAVRP